MSRAGKVVFPLIAGALLAFSCSCLSPAEPVVQPDLPKNAQQKVQQIRREQARAAAEVESNARTEAAGKTGIGGSGVTGSTPVLQPETPSGTITGRLEAAAPDHVVIRDADGVEHWFEADLNVQVSRDGEPAQLADLPRGTEVRASYAQVGQKRRLTEVQVLGAS